MKEVHVCPNCHNAVGWRGPPYQGKLVALKALLFRIRHGEWPFLRCSSCGYVVSINMWKKCNRVPKYEGAVKYPSFPPKPKAIHQNVGRFMKGKGKGQHKWYRRSIKSKKSPEEEDYSDEELRNCDA